MAPSKLPAVSYWQPWSTRDPFKARSTLPHTHLAQRASVTPARHQRRSAPDTSATHRWYHNGSQLDEDLSIKPANSLRKRRAIIIRIVANLMAVAKQLFDKTTWNKTIRSFKTSESFQRAIWSVKSWAVAFIRSMRWLNCPVRLKYQKQRKADCSSEQAFRGCVEEWKGQIRKS